MLDLLANFVAELRAAGLPVSLTENLDALEALRHIPVVDRAVFKSALAATLVKSHAHEDVFDTVFGVYFASRSAGDDAGDEPAPEGAQAVLATQPGVARRAGEGGIEDLTAEELAAMLYQAVRAGDRAALGAVARQAVTRYAGMEPGRPVGGSYYLYRALRNLSLEALVARLMAEAGPMTALAERLRREELEDRLSVLRADVEAEIRRRLVADRGPEAVAKTLRKSLPADVDFMHASREDLVALRAALAPLTRKLAVRLARKRRHGRRGPLDFRDTVRHSLSYGGVPAEPKYKFPRPAKPEIVVLADISGSVAAFARFTLQLVYAMSSHFSKVRSWVFIDGIDEVTAYFERGADIAEALQRVNAEADVIWADGHSDYGHALETFWARDARAVTSRTTVILLGDARNNYHAPSAFVVAEIAKVARHVYWLNPEPQSYWDTGDSVIGAYAPHCERVWECRNLRQLECFVDLLG